MKIDGLPPQATAANVAAIADVPPRQAARWRQALEQALWQDRQRVPAAPHEGTNAGAAGGAGPGPVAASDAAPQPTLPWATGQIVREVMAAIVEAAAKVDRVDLAAIAATPRMQPLAPLAVPAPPAAPANSLPASAPTRPLSSAAAPMPQRPVEAPAWPPFASQVSVRGQQVSASVRDARLGGADAESLRRELAVELARAGLELTELRVNGRSVVDSPRR